MKTISDEQIKEGQAVYTPLVLRIYDLWVVYYSNFWFWRCPRKRQLKHFQEHLSNNHLDIGVGTGYYLKHCTWPKPTRLALMDLNPNCLELSKAAVKEMNPELYQADIFKPQTQLQDQFSSISMNFLLHCLPGDMENKTQAIGNAVQMLQPNGVLSGATILGDKNLHYPHSSALAAFYNKKGIFSNSSDTYEGLVKALNAHLDDVKVDVVGCVALFSGVKKA